MEEDLIKFLAEDDIAFAKINPDNATKTNLLQLSKHFSLLTTYLSKLKSISKYFNDTFNIEIMTKNVLSNIETAKKQFLVDNQIGVVKDVTLNNETYRILRQNVNSIEIQNLTNVAWNVDSLIIDVKDLNGIKLYPVIKTIDNKITINFANSVFAIYKIFII